MNQRKAAGQIEDGLNDGEDILTYNGPKSRVTTVDCKGVCIKEFPQGGYQCDEYPPGKFDLLILL